MKPRYPMPAYPNGWFQIAVSSEIAPGELKTIKYFGRELVLFRTQEGKAHVLDAYCPHLGAHLGLGKVVENTIECRFHRWRYNGDGTVAHVPDATRVPAVKATCWNVQERNGIVFLWHHATGEAPTWEIPELGKVGTPAYMDWQVQKYRIRTHCQEIGENVTDKAHFTGLHEMDHPDESEYRAWPEGHVFCAEQHMKMAKGAMAGIEVPVSTRTHGPGVAILTVLVDPVETVSFITQTPIDEESVDAWVNFTLRKQDDPEADQMITEIYKGFLNDQYQDDIPIWETKKYVSRPPLSDFDGPVPLWRKWYRQFYSQPFDEEAWAVAS